MKHTHVIAQWVATAAMLLLPTVGLGQQASLEQQVAAIKADVKNYYWGEAEGTTYSEADRQALIELMSKISVSIESTIHFSDTEKEGEYKSEYNSSFRSFSHATLNGAQVIVLEQGERSHVFRYISKRAVEQMFEQREEKVRDYVRTAMHSEQQGKIDEALRHYYWGMKLLQSLIEPNKVYLDHEGQHMMLITEIPKRINNVLDNLQVSVMGQEGGDVDIYIAYKGQPVTSIDYTYFDGQAWSPLYSAKDGRGVMELRQGMTTDMVQLKYEYEYASECHIDREMATVMEFGQAIAFRKATVQLVDKGSQKKGKALRSQQKEMVARVSEASAVGSQVTAITDVKPYQAVMDRVKEAIRTKNYQTVRTLFTDNGWDMFDRLIHYGQARLLPGDNIVFLPDDNRVVARSLPMSFSFRNNNRRFVEDVTFTFTPDRRIESLAFGLGSEARTAIFDHASWPERSKIVLTSFLENYKTAYALKRLDYIESIFSEDAFIVTGHVLRKTARTQEGQPALSREEVSYRRHTKREYLHALERCFRSNQFINIRFSKNEVLKSEDGGELYGIQIKQDYYSSTYGDTGYLFLLVNINDPEHPEVSIRTWQPERNPDVTPMLTRDDPNYGLYNLGSF